MGISDLVAPFIVITTAATLHAKGVTDIKTCRRKPPRRCARVAGPLTFAVFTAGIITTGALALAGLAAYAPGVKRSLLAWSAGAPTPTPQGVLRDDRDGVAWRVVSNGTVAHAGDGHDDAPDQAPADHRGLHTAAAVAAHGAAGDGNDGGYHRRDGMGVGGVIEIDIIVLHAVAAQVWC